MCMKELHTHKGYDPVFVTVLAIGEFLWRSISIQKNSYQTITAKMQRSRGSVIEGSKFRFLLEAETALLVTVITTRSFNSTYN